MTDLSVGNTKCFPYEELYQITNGLSRQNLLGEGGFGCVFKGCLSDGREVAVKQLKDGGGQGEREFQAEVEIISRVHHRHLVSLVGYCIAENQRLLVYDYVPNNTLHYHLYGMLTCILFMFTACRLCYIHYETKKNVDFGFVFAAPGRPVMGWGIRVKVAAGSARGIAYLHEDCNNHSYSKFSSN